MVKVQERDLDEVLARHNVGVTSQDLAEEFDAALSLSPAAGATALTGDEVDYLTQHGGDTTHKVLGHWDPRGERDAHLLTVTQSIEDALTSSMSVAEAAKVLGVDRSRVSHRISAGSLYAFAFGRHRRVARWQFAAAGTLLPGLPQVIAAIPVGEHPLAVDAFMRTPTEELGDQTPIAYLAAGGDSRRVAQLVSDLARL
jgi:excisionase family DNA binding protein